MRKPQLGKQSGDAMELIHFLGLNCYHNCIVSIAHHAGVDYCAAFLNLWSEHTFRYEMYRKVYLSERLIENLALLGLNLDMALCFSPEEANERLAAIEGNGNIIVGMDAFYIPWNPFYQTFHGPHYFIAEKEGAEFVCFDPTYDKAGELISRCSIIAHVFDISYMCPVAERGVRTDLMDETTTIIHTHHDTRQRILLQIQNSALGEQENLILLAKYIDALISNRYLFQHYLTEKLPLINGGQSLLTRDFFSEWAAVKNGLLKASIKGNDHRIVQEVYRCFDQIIEREIAIAKKIQHAL